MKVMKFGGTSVGTPQRMKEVTNLVTKSGEPSTFGYGRYHQLTCRDL